MNHRQDPRQRGNPGAIVLLVGLFALVDLITWPVLEKSNSAELAMLFLGAAAGQGGLLASWAVLGPHRLLVRMPVSLLVTTLLWGVFLLGMAMVGIPDIRELARGTLMLPLILLAVQFPLWILKMATGWRIVVGGTQESASSEELRQFGLQHMLGTTTLVAVALGLAGLGLPRVDEPNMNANPTLWLGLMFACLILSVLSAFSILPCLWAAFVARNKAAGAVAIGIYAVLMSLLVVAVISATGGPGPPSEGVRLFVLFHGGLAFVLLGGLHLARLCGYVLLRPGRIRPPVRPTGSSPFADSSDPLAPPKS